MNKNKSKLISSVVIALTLGFSFSLHFIWADWTAPSSSPPDSNSPAPINASSTVQTKQGSLKVNSLGNQNGFVVTSGNVGVATITPAAMLDVAGGLKINYDGICNTNKAGTIRYDFSSKKLQYCDSSSWLEFKCEPYCPSGYVCGSDNCGGTCGTCPSSSNGASYCSGGNVYHNVTSYSCNSSHACVSTTTPTLVSTCTNGCSAGACIEPCTYTYSVGACNSCTNTESLTVLTASPSGCVGTPLTSRTAADACGGATTLSYGGYNYPLVSICGRCWFAENLQLNTGSNTCDPTSGCGSPWGRLYNWYTVTGGTAASACGAKIQGICPSGWHVPSGIMWNINGLYCYDDDVNRLVYNGNATCVKSAAYWNSPGTNTSGFNMPANGIYSPSQGFMGRLNVAEMWTSGMGWTGGEEHRSQLYLNSSSLEVYGSMQPYIYESARCVKD